MYESRRWRNLHVGLDAQELIRGAYVSIWIMCHLYVWRPLNMPGSGTDLEPCNLIELRPTVSTNTHKIPSFESVCPQWQ